MATDGWTAQDISDLAGRRVLVTGGNSGIGLEACRAFAARGAHTILGCRNPAKASEAVAQLRSESPDATVEAMPLDLANLGSVRDFAKQFCAAQGRLDILCNNAGVMALPHRETVDGFEMQIGTNHLGHFALTGLLLEPLLATPGARVVTVSSTFHRRGRIRFDDLQWKRGYRKWKAYAQSKLANLLFAYELQRRLQARGAGLASVAAHPGYASTNLQTVGARMEGSTVAESLQNLGNRLLAQSAAMGALPTLYAATAPDVRGGDYIGPDGRFEMRGHPVKVGSNPRSRDEEAARRLWSLSEKLTDVHYEALAG